MQSPWRHVSREQGIKLLLPLAEAVERSSTAPGENVGITDDPRPRPKQRGEHRRKRDLTWVALLSAFRRDTPDITVWRQVFPFHGHDLLSPLTGIQHSLN